MPGRFEQVWHGEPEPRIRALQAGTDDPPPREVIERFATYASEREAVATTASSIMTINQEKLRLVGRLLDELALTSHASERAIMLDRFVVSLRTIRECEYDLAPPEYSHEKIIYRDREVVRKAPAAGSWLEAVDDGE